MSKKKITNSVKTINQLVFKKWKGECVSQVEKDTYTFKCSEGHLFNRTKEQIINENHFCDNCDISGIAKSTTSVIMNIIDTVLLFVGPKKEK